jgi:hypothetical protein
MIIGGNSIESGTPEIEIASEMSVGGVINHKSDLASIITNFLSLDQTLNNRADPAY